MWVQIQATVNFYAEIHIVRFFYNRSIVVWNWKMINIFRFFCCCGVPNKSVSVFPLFKYIISSLVVSHSDKFFKSSVNLVEIICTSLPATWRTVSSANLITLESFILLKIYKNNIGPNIDPCGTPEKTSILSDTLLSYWTTAWRWKR